MTLAAEVTTRLSTQRLVELTNPDDNSVTTVNATRLAAAIADAQADFARITGVAFDEADAEHVAAGVAGVVLYLYEFRGLPGTDFTERLRATWEARCRRLARLLPRTTSLLTPTDPDLAGGPVRPAFDPSHLGDLRPRPPTAGSSFGLPDRV